VGTDQTTPTGPVGVRTLVRGVCLCLAAAVVPGALALAEAATRTQELPATVADGVYTDAQAARGAAVYDAACAGCHRADLGGGSGPALRDERFARQFAGKDLKTLYTKTATTMPRGAPGSLGDNVYLDIVAHLLKENGFRSGSRELTAEGLEAVRVVAGRARPAPPIGDFSYVDVVGCLTAGAERTWTLTQASEPVVAIPAASTSPPNVPGPSGSQAYRLVDAIAYAPESHRRQKVHVRGLLIRLAGEQRIAISALETISTTCAQ
jgi:mono/diheme cytochrome c family protein